MNCRWIPSDAVARIRELIQLLYQVNRLLSADIILEIFSFLQVLDFEDEIVGMDDLEFVSVVNLIDEVEVECIQFE